MSSRLLDSFANQRIVQNYFRSAFARCYSSKTVAATTAGDGSRVGTEKELDDPLAAAEELPVTFIEDEDLQAEREARIELARNKSRLSPAHRNMLHSRLPYEEPQSWIHETIKYKRTMLGRYGIEGSRVDPRICFPTKKETIEKVEYERVAFPHTLQEMMEMNRKARTEKQAKIRAREEEIGKKMDKLEHWIADLNARNAKKESEARVAKERKDRLVEEVRRHFGFKVDPRDERFQEMLAQKEKEDRKKVKEAKRKEKEEKMMEKLKKKTAELEDGSVPAEEVESK
ncbi:growth arrest and DNA damage-inducible proteins-interacting protein 1 [Uranotaenia lowii]|uniref:growth arrest and DNA damage-inducible proteins-interacting protein 1 n=1 Tax=Uranotaenia lowii TaxID=190385 RepID=UPI002478DF04|nr:growth arrest and DNA damage-inducible proteins-interacting protein 1 [Uranotaenia lowii]